MPAAGTRKVEVNGETLYIAGDHAQVTTLIREACEAQAQADLYQRRADEAKGKLIAIAAAKRNESGTVYLVGADGRRAKVEFHTSTKIDVARATALRAQLGPNWCEVFQVRPVYSCARGYQRFMESRKVPAAVRAAIAAAITIVPRRPAVTLIDLGETDG